MRGTTAIQDSAFKEVLFVAVLVVIYIIVFA